MHSATFESMGTVVSVRAHRPDISMVTHDHDNVTQDDVPVTAAADESLWHATLASAQGAFEQLDQRFSLYQEDSELSRVASGVLKLPNASDELRSEYARALEWREQTDGAFTPHRPDGVVDLSGTIKARAVERAHDVFMGAGYRDFSINAGGDILVAGSAGKKDSENQGWVTGISDPADRSKILSTVALTSDFVALCTSGTSERGEHIWSRPETDGSFWQASVIAHDILTADVLATAIIAGGPATLDLVTARFDVAVLVVKRDGELLANPQFRNLMTANSTASQELQ